MVKVVLATKNKGKIAELDEILKDYGVKVLGLDSFPEIGDIPETGDTFEENSAIKAEAVCRATGLIALADDSGLVVDALSGRPGVYSARYAGEQATDEENWQKLLAELKDVSDDKRTARFMCVMTAVMPNGNSIVGRGAWEGLIAREPKGENGFGYDPVFFDPELGRTSAQMTREEKNSRSHRKKALEDLKQAFMARMQGL